MAAFPLSRWWLLSVVLLLPAPPQAECRNVTHEDIRDAMLSILHMFRTSEDKLERHEYREKALGDQLKKILAGLEKRHRALEPLKGMISRIDERLSNVETILFQKEEREKTTQKKTNEALESIQRSLQTLTGGGGGAAAGAGSDRLDAIQRDIEGLKNSLSKESLRAMCLEVASDSNPLEKHISEAEKLLNKYELRLNESNGARVQTDFVPLSEVSLADEAWHSRMSEVMERQEGEIRKIRHLLSDAEGLWKELPRRSDLAGINNDTLKSIQEVEQRTKDTVEQSVSRVSTKLRELGDRLAATNEDIQRSLTQANNVNERGYLDLQRGLDTLRAEVSKLSVGERVLLETADNVIATKKRVEYGVHQILLEVGELVKNHANGLNQTFTDRFDTIESRVLETQSGALSNVSSKIEAEMSAVWRQVGVMYQQLSASKLSLDKLTEQTESYVNGSGTTLDSMKDKVGMITTRMSEVDDNLNYLLGRLSLVTQEFSQVKSGLGEALDKVKASFHTVQDKLDDVGPGPHNITTPEQTT